MNTYTIYLGATPIATVNDTESAYACFEAARTIADFTGKECSLVWDDTGEVVADCSFCEDYEPDVDECGFDPYEGCYTYDC